MSGQVHRRAVADRVLQLQRNYDVHEGQCDRCILGRKRRGCPMPMTEEGEAPLILHVSQSI
jgi:hypothetical protein